MASREVIVNLKVEDLVDVKAMVDDLRADRDAAVARAEAAEQAIERVRALIADVDTWTPYDSRDTGETFLAESVRDLLADIRHSLDPAGPTDG